jgi:hypothetical protein
MSLVLTALTAPQMGGFIHPKLAPYLHRVPDARIRVAPLWDSVSAGACTRHETHIREWSNDLAV